MATDTTVMKDLYLYAQSAEILFRLNITKLCEEGRAHIETMLDYRKVGGSTHPLGMGLIIVDSKLYLIGGTRVDDDFEEHFNLDAFAFNLTDPEDPLVGVRDGFIPRLSGVKPRPIVITLEGKIYVLPRHSYYKSLSELNGDDLRFEVFDPNLADRKWETLTTPPFFVKHETMQDYFAWGHRLVVRTRSGLCMFDARKNEWEDGREFRSQFGERYKDDYVPFPAGVAAEFEGFWIAMSAGGNALVAYDFDPNGVLKSHRVLTELSAVFVLPLPPSFMAGFVTHLGEGRMCFLLNGEQEAFPVERWRARVAIFQVAKNVGGDPVISAHLERLHGYDLEDWNCTSPFIESVAICKGSKKCAAGYIDSDVFKKAKSTLHA